MVFNATFNNISVVLWKPVFIGGGNWSTWRNWFFFNYFL